VGIAVALVSVTLYNALLRRAKVLTIEWEMRQREAGKGLPSSAEGDSS
jgi:biopolymer transport protein ExbB/TolQ